MRYVKLWFNPLKITCITGIFLVIIVGGTLALSAIMGKKSGVSGTAATFSQLLFEYDRQLWNIESGGAGSSAIRPETDGLDAALDRMEKKAASVDALLSVLKRRRQLVRHEPQYLESDALRIKYRQAAMRAHKQYPHSQTISALAAAALVQERAITEEAEEALRALLPSPGSPVMDTLRLSLHVLLGDMHSPHSAIAAMPEGFAISSLPDSFADPDLMIINAAVLKAVRADSAAAEIIELFRGGYEAASPRPHYAQALAFAADYYFDFGNLLTAAELFNRMYTHAQGGEYALLRQADALWLAGYADNARTIWKILASGYSGLPAGQAGAQERALYNLALTETSSDEAYKHLYAIASLPRNENDFSSSAAPASREYGIIRYSRTLNPGQAIPLLESETAAIGKTISAAGSITRSAPGSITRSAGESPFDDSAGAVPAARHIDAMQSISALLELEILRRRVELWNSGQVTGAVWMLLGKYPFDERLYQWADWYFIRQRNYPEAAILLRTGARHGLQFPLSEAVLNINEGNYDTAEQILSGIVSDNSASWAAQANLGRIREARRDPRRSLQSYELAAAAVSNSTDASRIQFRIAQCLKTLGRVSEARQALGRSLELNPNNHTARLELGRLGN